ncbi:MAG: hypothetical protein COV45_03840 [Deltaproteobacteria bacterium CG11_big_fil_rev_8_21_14_0_20_47_16]|nr:MAG: hypothetical protein COV45_03840 [Deltaproteobacteria bacterium CG11_big_fil_rev_8_21_14_0_20_47_16]
MRHRLLPTIVFLASLIFSPTIYAVTFTGHASTDFPSTACITDPTPFDPNGQDVQFVVSGAVRVSGFDATKLCILYDSTSDSLQVATLTHNNTANTDVITGDADGNGDPAGISSDLSGSGVQDIANLGAPEFFSLLMDFDFTVNNGFSIVVGKASNKALTDYGVFAAGSTSIDDSNTASMFGAAEGAAIGSAVFASPSTSQPHLEFSVAHFKSMPGLTLDWTDPNDAIALYFTMGNAAATPIPSETFPSKIDSRFYYGFYPLTVAHLLQTDADGDGIIDDLDTDDDGDGISDLIEMGINSCDLDGGGVLSVSQDANGNGQFDAGEEGEILKCTAGGFNAGGIDIVRKAAFPGGVYPDFDSDGIPNYLDTDSDGDGLSDNNEDKNGNGIVDTGETSPLDTDTDDDGISDLDEFNKFLVDTDSDGLSDGDEIENYGTDPSKPDSDNDGLSDGDEVNLYGTDPLKADTDGGGARDGLEVQQGTDPLNPGDDNIVLAGPTTSVAPGEVDAGTIDPNLAGYSTNEVHLSGSGLTSCSLNPTNDSSATPSIIIIICAMIVVPVFFRKKKVAITAVTLFGLLMIASPAKALDVQLQRLPMNGYGGLFMDNTQMLGQYHWNVAVGFDYTLRPLQMSLISTGGRLDNVVDYFVTQDTNIAFGIADWLDVNVAFQSNTPSKVEPVGATTATTEANFGDLMISTKFQLLDPVEERYGLGLVVIPFVTFPTGDDSRYFGNDGMTGGFKVVGERYFGRTDVYAMMGALFKSTENLQINLNVGSNFLFAIGAQHPISTHHDFIILGEFSGSTTFNKFMHQENTSPVEMNGGLRKYWFNRAIAATVSVGTGIDSGYGAPRVRTMANLSYFSHPANDRDDDTIHDPEDYCPTQFMDTENPGARPGCPNINRVVKIVGDRILIFRPINFETGSSVITGDSMMVIDQIAALIQQSPELKKVLVEGHTDNVGGEKLNQQLSEERAKAVVDSLVTRGVSANRLTSRGWGMSKPLTSNSTEDGRAKNRRVEFHILEIK